MSEWKERTVDELCLKITDGSHFSPQEVEHGFPMFSVKDMEQNGFSYKAVKKISFSDYKKLEKSDCKPLKNDVLIAKDGSYLKHVFVCKEEREEVILSSIAILRPDTEKINPDFFKYILSSPSVKNMMANYVSGVAIPRIILNDFKKMTLNIPTEIPTQQKIANILGTYDELIEVNNERIKILEETAQSLYKEWFVRFRFPNYQNTEFIKGVPKGWEVKEIKGFGKVVTGKTPSTLNPSYFNGEVPFIKTPDMHGNMFVLKTSETLTELGVQSQRNQTIPKYSIIVNCIGSLSGTVSITTERSQTNQQINSLILNNINNLEYLYFAIADLKEMIELYGNTGSTMTNLSKGKFEGLKILKPLDYLLEDFHNLVNPMFIQIETLQQQNTELRQIRDRLLPRLISGKLLV